MSEETLCSRTILLVDDEVNITRALKRTLRSEGYTILTADSGAEGLELLAVNEVGVIISDQRMPQMTGVEFLRKVKALYPKTFRMVLSGYTELESVTRAINEGAIYKFLTKPWEDEQLRENIREAFQLYEMEKENRRLGSELQKANDTLSMLNMSLVQQVAEKTREIVHNINILQISQEVLEHLPIAVIGVDDQDMIAVSNRRADALFRRRPDQCLLGLFANDCLPESLLQKLQQNTAGFTEATDAGYITLAGDELMHVWVAPMGVVSRSRGTVIALSPHKAI